MSPDDPNADAELGPPRLVSIVAQQLDPQKGITLITEAPPDILDMLNHPALNTTRRLGLVFKNNDQHLVLPPGWTWGNHSESEAASTQAVTAHQDHDDVSALSEDGSIADLDCDGIKPLVRRDDPDNDDDLDESAPSGVTASPRLTVVPNDAEKQAQALRCIELMLGQIIDHAYTDNLNALHSAEVERDAVMGSLPQRVFTVKVGSHTLITDHPNVMRLLAPWLEVHRTVAADLPECAYRVNVALTLTPAHRLG